MSIDLSVKIDGGTVLKPLQDIRAELVKVQETTVATNKTMNEGFASVGKAEASILPEIVATNKELQNRNKIVQEQKKMLDETTAAVQKMANMGGLFKPSEINELGKALQASKNDFESLGIIIDTMKKKLASIDPKSAGFSQLSKEISSAESMLNSFNVETDKTTTKQKTLKSEFRNTLEAMAQLSMQNKENSKEYADLKKKAGELADTLADVRQEAKQAGSDTRGFDHLIRTMNVAVGSFTAVQGAAALFGNDNKHFQETLIKLNGAMAILNGLQAIQNELTMKDSQLRIIAIAAQNAWTWAIDASSLSLRVFRVALLATGIGAAIVILGYAAEAMGLFGNETEDTTEKLDKQNEKLQKYYELQQKVADQAELSRNAERGGLDDLKRQLSAAEARGNSEKDILRLKKEVNLQEQHNLGVAIASTDEVKKKEELEKQLKDKKQEYANIDLANIKKNTDEQKKANDEKLKLLGDIKKLTRSAEDDRIATIKDSYEKERLQREAAYNRSIEDLDSSYKQLIKSANGNESVITQLKTAFSDKRRAINNKYYSDDLIAEAEQVKKLLQIKQTGMIARFTVENKQQEIELIQVDQHYQELAEQLKKAGESEQGIEEAKEKAKNAIRTKYAVQHLENQKDEANKMVDLINLQGVSEDKATIIRENMKLAILKEFAQKQIAAILQTNNVQGSISVDAINKYRNYLLTDSKKGETPVSIFEFMGIDSTKLSEEDRKKILDIVTNVSAEIDKTVKKIPKQFNTIGDLLGLTGKGKDSFDKSLSSIQDSFGKFTDSLAAMTQAQIQEIDNRIAKRDEEISKQEDAVKREQELADKGIANNLKGEQDKLKSLKSLRDKDLADKKKAQEELEKIRKAQAIARSLEIASQAALQISNMATGATSMFVDGASKGGVIGAIAAVAAIAATIAAVMSIISTIKAADTNPDYQSHAEGDVVDGSAHADGGNKYIAMNGNKASIREIESGEFITKKRQTQKYLPLLRAINKDELSSWTYNDMMRFVSPVGVQFDDGVLKNMIQMDRNVRVQQASILNQQSSSSDQYLKQIASSNQKLVDIEEGKEHVEETKSLIIRKKGNTTTIIHKQK